MRSLAHCPAASAREPAGFPEPFRETWLMPLAVMLPSMPSPQQSHWHCICGTSSLTYTFAKGGSEGIFPSWSLVQPLCPGTAGVAFTETSPIMLWQIRIWLWSVGAALRA